MSPAQAGLLSPHAAMSSVLAAALLSRAEMYRAGAGVHSALAEVLAAQGEICLAHAGLFSSHATMTPALADVYPARAVVLSAYACHKSDMLAIRWRRYVIVSTLYKTQLALHGNKLRLINKSKTKLIGDSNVH